MQKIRTITSSTEDKIRHADFVKIKDLLDISSGKILAVRIQNFYSPKICKQISGSLASNSELEGYRVEPKFLRSAESLFDTVDDKIAKKRYFHSANSQTRSTRGLFFPYLSPIDKLILDLLPQQPFGVKILHLAHACTFGQTRVARDGGSAKPHDDILDEDVDPKKFPQAKLKAQLSFNTYLALPQNGGELELWDYIAPKFEKRLLKEPRSYGYDRKKIPPSTVLLKPKIGEAILFNSWKVHAVSPSLGGVRVTASVFCGISKRGHLVFWS